VRGKDLDTRGEGGRTFSKGIQSGEMNVSASWGGELRKRGFRKMRFIKGLGFGLQGGGTKTELPSWGNERVRRDCGGSGGGVVCGRGGNALGGG